MYDFHKIRNGDYYCENKSEFRHEEFSRDNKKSISKIKRKGFQSKSKDKKANIKNKKISKSGVKAKPKKKTNPAELPIPKHRHHNIEDESENSFFGDLSIERDNNKEETKSLHESALLKITTAVKEYYRSKSMRDPDKKCNKINDIIELAEQLKDRWIEAFGKISGVEDINAMKELYYTIKDSLPSTPHHLETETLSSSLISSSLKSATCIPKKTSEAEVEPFQMIEEEDALIESIFRAEIRSTLVCITSETFLNTQFLRNVDTLMGI
jgi:hypothetical protein